MARKPTKLYRDDVAAMVGIKANSLGRAKLPPPDGYDNEAGHARPWWTLAAIQNWVANRPGKAWRRGVRNA